MSDNEDYFSNNSDSDSVSDNDDDISVSSSENDDDVNLEEKKINDDEAEEIDEDDDGELIIDNDNDELDDDDDDDYEYDIDSQTGGADDNDVLEKSVKNKSKKKLIIEKEEEDDDDDDDMDDENYLQKFDSDINKSYIEEYHPECIIHNFDEISVLTQIVRDSDYNVIDPLHKTVPFLTKYEKTRIIGQRAKQINSGAKPFIQVPENVIDGYLIAEMELQQKRIPFIIRRPLNNGGSEYWNLKDLEIIDF